MEEERGIRRILIKVFRTGPGSSRQGQGFKGLMGKSGLNQD
ncbi:hypothetical protein LINPERPRIM_LOCUS10157 [Linum perenne]